MEYPVVAYLMNKNADARRTFIWIFPAAEEWSRQEAILIIFAVHDKRLSWNEEWMSADWSRHESWLSLERQEPMCIAIISISTIQSKWCQTVSWGNKRVRTGFVEYGNYPQSGWIPPVNWYWQDKKNEYFRTVSVFMFIKWNPYSSKLFNLLKQVQKVGASKQNNGVLTVY